MEYPYPIELIRILLSMLLKRRRRKILNCFLLALQFEERLYYRNNKCRRKYLYRLYRKYELREQQIMKNRRN